jgi:hypothetical protein
MRAFLGLLFLFYIGHSVAEESHLSEPFKITSIKYRGSNSANNQRYPDCHDCILVEGGSSGGCGSGFVIKGANSGNDESKFMASLVMMAYASGTTVVMGREHCIKWNDSWKAHVNRVYLIN